MLAIRHRNDSVSLLPIAGLLVEREQDAQFIASLQGRDPAEMENRFANGHRAYVAWLDGQPAAWGWVATARAEIGELTTAFEIPRQQRYLWNFVTLPAYRGRGIYPRLLDAIVRNELADAEIFWVAYAPENAASAAGIHKAGFATVATLSFDSEGHPAVTGQTQAHAAAASRGEPSSSTAKLRLLLNTRGNGCTGSRPIGVSTGSSSRKK